MPDPHPFLEAYELINQREPVLAVKIARSIASRTKMEWPEVVTFGGILIDAGSTLGRRRLVKEGIALIESVLPSVSEEYLAATHYNLGTGYSTLGRKERGIGPGTRISLTKAVSYLNGSLRLQDRVDTRINLAGVLLGQGRWIEACDELVMILKESPAHHVALAQQAEALTEVYRCSQRHTGLLIKAISNYRKAKELAQNIPLYSKNYEARIQGLETRIKRADLEEIEAITPKPRTKVENWIWENRLALNMCPLCEIDSPDAFDTNIINSVLAGGTRRPKVTEVYDLVNSLHRSFGTARWCLMQGMGIVKVSGRDQIAVISGSPNVRHDLKTGLILSAFSGFYSILSQVAFGLNSYLHLGHSETFVTFQKVWNSQNTGRSIPKIRSDLHPRIRRSSSPAMAALYHLALSLEHGLGIYDELRELRNSIEHHVIVASTEGNYSKYFKTVPPQILTQSTAKMGRLAKAAMLYFGSVIWESEYSRLKRARRRGVIIQHGDGPKVERI